MGSCQGVGESVSGVGADRRADSAGHPLPQQQGLPHEGASPPPRLSSPKEACQEETGGQLHTTPNIPLIPMFKSGKKQNLVFIFPGLFPFASCFSLCDSDPR